MACSGHSGVENMTDESRTTKTPPAGGVESERVAPRPARRHPGDRAERGGTSVGHEPFKRDFGMPDAADQTSFTDPRFVIKGTSR